MIFNETNTDRAVFGDVDGRSTTEDHGKEATPYRFLLTRELLGVYRDSEGRTGMQRAFDAEGPRGSRSTMVAITEVGTLGGGGDRVRCPLVILGNNPSVATREINDNTIRKEIGFAQRLGFGRLVKANAHGWRDTKPKHMEAARKAGRDIVGADNAIHIRDALLDAWNNDGMAIVAWGKHPKPERLLELRALISSVVTDRTKMLYCLRTNKDGSPEHPLYVPYVTVPVPWRWQS